MVTTISRCFYDPHVHSQPKSLHSFNPRNVPLSYLEMLIQLSYDPISTA